MKSRRTKSLRSLQRSVSNLNIDLEAISEEHDRYCPDGSVESVASWYNSLPIETLGESLAMDREEPRAKYSLQDIIHKESLAKLHSSKLVELEEAQTQLRVAKIDSLIRRIKKDIK